MRIVLTLILCFVFLPAFSSPQISLFDSSNWLVQNPLPMTELMPSKSIGDVNEQQGRMLLSMQKSTARLKTFDSTKLIKDGRQVLPDMQIDYVINQQGEVIPDKRHLILTEHPYWDYFVGVGTTWPADKGQTVAKAQITLPFALVEKNENCVHNGVLVIESNKSNQPPQFYYQISSETCAYFKGDFWGTGMVEFSANEELDAQALISQYKTQQKNRIPVLPLEALYKQTPELDLAKLALSTSISAQDMSVYGLLLDDQHYLSNCQTRAGPYPFCEQLVLPSYSTAKSLFAGLTMFYLEQQYGDVFAQPINKWVKQCQAKQWQGVTFGHLLDMSSGNYDSSSYAKDEGAKDKLAFFNAKTNQHRLEFACQHYARKSQPGTTFVYHTSETYLLGVGLNAYLKSKLGDDAEIFADVVLKHIFKPLNLSQISFVSRRTQDSVQQAYTGYGLFFTPDDLVKLMRFIQQQVHINAAQSLLAQSPLKAALQLDLSNPGLSTDFANLRYQHSFWARKIPPQSNCNKVQWAPFMSGYGGITLALFGQGKSYYYFSDKHQYDWSEAVTELQKLQQKCINSTPAIGSHITWEN